ncbi:MAG: ZPR1 zinc finger domain-containing protein [Candidatus Nanoarchaeia archaeon]|nr:ZPR1 zinc finger domain-containing protein [Candidatus Nanoarchaeia archaeon]MDD5587945.1 ZPR1 zinc finger domain-containing protein [Candidatus Nanoarchaeia archaeon]
MEELKKQECPLCKTKNLTLAEEEKEVPHFGKVYLFSMVCSNCNYKVSDVEAVDVKEPVKITFTVENVKDLNVKVVKSSSASVKLVELRMDMTPGPASIGFISNIEGLITKFEEVLKAQKETAEEDEDKTKAKNLLKKIWKIKCGDIPLKIVIEDPSGNSAILSDKAKVEKLKVK